MLCPELVQREEAVVVSLLQLLTPLTQGSQTGQLCQLGQHGPLVGRHVVPHPDQELSLPQAVVHPQTHVHHLDDGGLGSAASRQLQRLLGHTWTGT